MFTYNSIWSLLVMNVLFIMNSEQQLKDPAFMANLQKYVDECEKEIGIDASVVDKAWKENHFPNDEKLKCFFKCLNMKWGVIDQTGEVVDDVLRAVASQFVDTATRTEIVEECGAIHGSDLCETAMKLTACVKAAELD